MNGERSLNEKRKAKGGEPEKRMRGCEEKGGGAKRKKKKKGWKRQRGKGMKSYWMPATG